MSDALSFPPRPDLDHYRTLAKELRRACRSGEHAAVYHWAAPLDRWADAVVRCRH